MTQPTLYQYVKLGSNLEFLRGISPASVMQTASLAGCPNLLGNMSSQRYSVVHVVGAIKSLLVQLEEMQLVQSLAVAEHFRPMAKQMDDYLSRQPRPDLAFLDDGFAERLVAIAKLLGTAVRSELSMAAQPTPKDS